ncbi:MAG: DUF2270 domain-containing protein [Bacteroidota bacterium]
MEEFFTSSPQPEENRPKDSDEPVWTYRGYRLKTSEFVTAMVHLFRAEIQRANVWRQRLDATTNWAVVTTGAVISISFSQSTVHHGIIILNTLLVTLFLFIESRRYRYYELWSYRVRLMETDFYAAMLVPPFHPSPDWAESLAENLLSPSFPISMWEALGRRLRRNYFWIFLILGASWLAKSWLFPKPPANFAEFVQRCSVGPIPGNTILMMGALFYGFLIVLALATINMAHASGEVLPRFGPDTITSMFSSEGVAKVFHPAFAPHRRRKQLVALIITGMADAVSSRIMADLRRGVTALSGKGMYTGQERSVLICAITITEVHNLKSAVAREDPSAFVVVSAAQEILGRGFNPLNEKE